MSEQRVDRLDEMVGEIRETLARNTTLLEINTQHLAEHMRRTDILEKHVQGLATEARIVRWLAAAGAVIATVIQLVASHK